MKEDKEFTDVTLACEDGQQAEVHKLVLIAYPLLCKNLEEKQTPTSLDLHEECST